MEALLYVQYADEAAVLTVALQQAGMVVRGSRNLDGSLEAWLTHPADLILLSGLEAKGDPIARIKKIRALTPAPVAMISPPLDENVEIELLNAGVDLVITRPYSVRILIAQIRTLLRRSANIPNFSLPSLTINELVLDPAARAVKVGTAKAKRLTQLEFRLLYTLMTHPGQIIPTESIVEHVWGYSGDGNRDLVRGLVQRLRTKVEKNPRDPKYILTELGVGYFFSTEAP